MIKIIFLLQLIVSVLGIIILTIILIINNISIEKTKEISNLVEKNINVIELYKNSVDYTVYFGVMYIEKINLEYPIFNRYSDELLKISLCKFSGGSLGEEENICIVGHNYENNEFFSKLNKLNNNDEIIIKDFLGNEFRYLVYDIKEVSPYDVSVLKNNRKYELTLLTCNNSNKKRFIVKAFMDKK